MVFAFTLVGLLNIFVVSFVVVWRSRRVGTSFLVRKVCRLVIVYLIGLGSNRLLAILSPLRWDASLFLRLNQFLIFYCILLLENGLFALLGFVAIVLRWNKSRIIALISSQVLQLFVWMTSILNGWFFSVSLFLAYLLLQKIWLLHLSLIVTNRIIW